MKISSLALFAWMLLAPLAVADDAAAPIPLPRYPNLSPAAQSADEAPRWTAAPGASANPPATVSQPAPGSQPAAVSQPEAAIQPAPGTFPAPSTSIPAVTSQPATATVAPGTATLPINGVPTAAAPAAAAPIGAPNMATQPATAPVQPPQQFPPVDDAKPLQPATVINSSGAGDNIDVNDQPRPLHSVMIRRAPKTAPVAQPEPTAEVAPAHYEETLPSPPTRAPSLAPSNMQSIPRSATSSVTTVAPPAAPAVKEAPADPEKVAAARAAGDLLATSFEPRPEGPTAVSLLEALAQAGEGARAAAIRDYWRLSRAWSDYSWAEQELKQLEAVVPSRGPVDGPMLSTARAAAAARVNDAKLAIETAQDGLLRSAHLPIKPEGYRPTDVPLVGPYHTYFSVLFANRESPGRTLQIERSLPIRLKAINDRTAAVQSATSAIHYAEEAHAKGESDIRTVLACHEAIYHQRRALLEEVLNYNIDIADYVTTVATPGTPNEKLVGMLIEAKPADRMSAVPASATTFVPSNATGHTSPSGTTRSNSSDGWVPSTMRTIEPTAARSSSSQPTPASRSNTPTPATQPDPFASPNVGDRYGTGTR